MCYQVDMMLPTEEETELLGSGHTITPDHHTPSAQDYRDLLSTTNYFSDISSC